MPKDTGTGSPWRKAAYFTGHKRREKHPDVDWHHCLEALSSEIRRETEPKGRIRIWGYSESRRHIIRVILEPDGRTILNAFVNGQEEKRQSRRAQETEPCT